MTGKLWKVQGMDINCRRNFIRLSSFLLILILILPLRMDAASARAHLLKAAFLLQFVKYTRWPVDNADQIIIGIFGDDPVVHAFTSYGGKRAHGKNLIIKKVNDLQEASTCCQLIFIGLSAKRHITEVISALGQSPVLTVSEIDDFMQKGGMIHLVRRSNKQNFTISINNADKANLNFSPRMLKVALAVEK